MIIDTSTVTAILLDEPDMEYFAKVIATAERRLMSTAAGLELTMVIKARLGEKGFEDVERFLEDAAITLVPFDTAQLAKARDAWRRFGKGRHPAKLNFGDCIAFALAKTSGLPLLFKGNDFSCMDIAAA